VFDWKFHTFAAEASINYQLEEDMIDLLERMTGGRIKLTHYAGGELVGFAEQIEAAGQRVFEITHHADGFHSFLDPAFGVLTNFPVLMRDFADLLGWYYNYGGREVVTELYAEYNLLPLEYVVMGAEPIMSNVPIRTIADFQGIKMRSVPGLATELYSDLGASVVALGGGEVYTALDTGVIDATEFIGPASNYAYGLHEVTKYITYPAPHNVVGGDNLSINLDAWNELPDDLKAALESAIKTLSLWNGELVLAEDRVALKKMEAAGLVIYSLPESDWVTMKQIALENAEDYAAKSPMARKVVDTYLDALRSMGRL
jgi:TRAP-type mannitol/chloroaromatic compound transport system substrate-binding protein